MATHSSILPWEIPWTEKPGGLQTMGSHSQTRLSDWAHTCLIQVKKQVVFPGLWCGVPGLSAFYLLVMDLNSPVEVPQFTLSCSSCTLGSILQYNSIQWGWGDTKGNLQGLLLSKGPQSNHGGWGSEKPQLTSDISVSLIIPQTVNQSMQERLERGGLQSMHVRWWMASAMADTCCRWEGHNSTSDFTPVVTMKTVLFLANSCRENSAANSTKSTGASCYWDAELNFCSL